MTGTILDYLKNYGEYSFSERPFNDVDSLVLCQFVYLKFDGMVPLVTDNKRAVNLPYLRQHAKFDLLFADVRFEKNNRALFEAMEKSTRFGKLKLNCYINIVEPEWETQFSAVTFFLEDHTMYVAFRGTDESMVGWKEDFNMAFQSPIPGQLYAAKYLNMVTGRLHNDFYIGGHSKGGNLAVYAAMTCTATVQDRILKIYSMDGPGFPREVLEKNGYDRIADRVIKILPHSSMVGMLFESDTRYKVVESKTFGLLQHDPFSWLVKEDDFDYVNHLYGSRKFTDDALNDWILSLSVEDRKLFVDTLYNVILASKATNLIDFTVDLKKSLTGMVAAMKDVDEDTKKAMKKIIRGLFEIAFLRLTPKKKMFQSKDAKKPS